MALAHQKEKRKGKKYPLERRKLYRKVLKNIIHKIASINSIFYNLKEN